MTRHPSDVLDDNLHQQESPAAETPASTKSQRPRTMGATEAVMTIIGAVDRWSENDVVRLAGVVALGPASALANDPTPSRVERDQEPGGVAAQRRLDGERHAQALSLYRGVSRDVGRPMAPPGKVTS